MIYSVPKKGFTLIETLVAISVLTVAIAAPLVLASQSLMTAYQARDNVVAFNLAQEAIEAVRAQRDHNLLNTILTGSTDSWLTGLTHEGIGDPQKPFMVDSLSTTQNFIDCSGSTPGSCSYLKFDENTGFYGHENGVESRFKRYVRIVEVPNTNGNEMRVISTVEWRSGIFGTTRQVVLQENIYNWISGLQ